MLTSCGAMVGSAEQRVHHKRRDRKTHNADKGRHRAVLGRRHDPPCPVSAEYPHIALIEGSLHGE